MKETEHVPRTLGELRRRLAEMGDPWTVDPRFGDDDPLPDPPRGAQRAEDIREESQLDVVPAGADVRELLKEVPPANPFLRRRWVELGLMTANESPLGEESER